MATTPTTTVRVTVSTRDQLTALAREREQSTSELLTDLAQQATDEALLAQAQREWAANADFVRQENAVWDGLAGDGLDGLA